MRLKRIALLLSVTMLLSIIGIPSYAQDDYAVLTFGKGGKQVQMSTNVVADNTVRDGMEAIILDPDDSSANMNIYMGNSFSMLSDGTCVILSVTYYDEGEGKFTLFYDGVNGQTEHPDIVRLKNTCTWKTKVYELQNPKFNKSVGGADIKISLKTEAMDKSAGKIIISEVKVEKTDYKSVYLADISTDGRPGNIYFSDEELAFGVKIRKNDVMQVYSDNCDITYYICDDLGNVIWNKSEENVDIRQGYNKRIVPETLKYGLYDFYVTIENKEKNYKSTYTTYFSYAVSARKNPRFGAKNHYGHQYPDPEKAIILMEKSGMGFTNGGWSWAGIESQKGIYSYGTGPVSRFQNVLAESDIDNLNGFTYGNMIYTGAPTHTYMPVTDEGREGFANAAVWALKEHKSHYIEVWNEPDMTNFNPGHASWTEYTELLKTTYKKVKEFDENIKVIGGSIVSIPLLPKERAKGIIDAGGGEYMDAFSIHPYIWETSPLNDDFESKLPYAGKLFEEMGYPDMELWITELGWGSGDGQKFTHEQQAAYLVQCYLMSVSYKNFGNFLWYDFQNDGLLETNKEHNFGVIRHWNDHKPWGAKKSFIAASYMNDLMSGAEFVDNADDGSRGRLYHFRNDGKDIYALFSSEKVYLSGLSVNKDDFIVNDMYGNDKELSAVDGVLNILGGEEVTYIIGEELEVSFTEPTFKIDSLELEVLYGEGSSIEIGMEKDISIDYFTSDEVINVQKNENTLDVEFTEFSADTEKLYIIVNCDDKKVLDGNILLKCVQPISVTIENDLFNLKNFNRWRGYLTVTNHSKTNKSASGKLVFTSPDLFSKKLPAIAIPELKPGQVKTIKFHFPEILRKEAYDLNAIISLDNGYVTQISDRIDFAVAPYTSVQPTIDGKIENDEWVMGAALEFNQKEQAVNIDGFTWTGKEDLSGRVCFEYDEKNLYLGAVVQDDIFNQTNSDSTIWKGDSIQFAVGYSRANGNKGAATFTEVGLALTPEGEKVCVYQTEDVSLGKGILDLEALGIECKISREGTTTIYELKMPWKCLSPGGSVFEGGKNVAFSMLVNDNDGLGRKGWLEYASGIGKSKNINLFTFLKLMDK